MYEAIVFLPLLGAVIAGAIALVGASHRHPGASPPPPDDDHAAPLVPDRRMRMVRRGRTPRLPKSVIRARRKRRSPSRASARRQPS